MQQFDLYPQAWAVYILLGIALLFMLDLKLRKTGFKRRVAILSLIATGAFTPDTVTDANSFAPIILTSLLDAEVQGSGAIIQGLITLLIIWGIIFASTLAIRHLFQASKSKQKTSETKEDPSK
jgi:hypothetical protein